MKNAYNISKFCKAAGNKVIYEETETHIAVADERGAIGIYILKPERTDSGILQQLRAKKITLTEREGLGKVLSKNLFTENEVNDLYDTEIHFPYISDGRKVYVTALKQGNADKFKYVNVNYMDIFDYDLIATADNQYSPITFVCRDCYGIVCPMIIKRNNAEEQQKQLRSIASDILRRA